MYEAYLEGKYIDIGSHVTKHNRGSDDLSNKPFVVERFIQIMEDNDLIVKSINSNKELTGHAKYICENGGWLTRVGRLRIIESRNEETLMWDSQLTKWNVKTKWWPHVFTGFGLLFSLIALVVALRKSPIEEELLKLQLEQLRQSQPVHPTIQPTLDSEKIVLDDSSDREKK